jgi:hypothetical protein
MELFLEREKKFFNIDHQLTFLDLSGNRISSLPVELRFMTTVIELNLGENPLTCPPANVRTSYPTYA